MQQYVLLGKMLTYNHFIWFLLCHWICCTTILGHPTWSEEVKAATRSSKNDSTSSEAVDTSSSHLLSPGNDTLECAVPWSCCDHENCKCKDILPNGIVKCGKKNTLSIRNSYCLTIDEKTDTLEAGQCLYNYNTYDFMYNDLPRNKTKLNDFMCNKQTELHRTGTLCGKCQDGYYPLAYSFDMTCVQCPNGKFNWWKFVLAAFLPLTVFCFIILFFKINVVSSRFQGFLFYSQMISLPAMVRVFVFLSKHKSLNKDSVGRIGLQCLTTSYGIWNLDFFRSANFGICLGTDTLQTLTLDLIVGVYPLLLMVVTYVLIELYDRNFKPLVIMWKPFRTLFGMFRKNWDLRTSIIDSFATILLLTNIKLQSVSFDLFTPVTVYQTNKLANLTFSYRLFYDATVSYFGSRHLPYAITAAVVAMVFSILPVMLLILYPFCCFQKFLNRFPFRWYILHTFVDSFYGSYKDGTQPGTRDCRWFASLFFLSRFCMMFAGAFLENATYFPIAATILTVVALLHVTVQPFKENVSHFASINAFFLLLLAMWYTCVTGSISSAKRQSSFEMLYFVMALIVVILPLMYISAIVLHWIYSQRKFGTDVIAKLSAWRNGYKTLL